MQQISTPRIFIALMPLLLMAATVSAQWVINSSAIPDLETQTSGGFGTYNNVIIDNHLAVGLGAGSTTSCPSITGGTSTTDYPFVVNDLPGGNAIVLWDNSADQVRNIIGLSPAGGVAVYSGNDYKTGSGLRLNSPGATAFPAGSAQMISNGSGVAGVRAYEHLNWNTTTSNLDNIFSLDQNGDERVTGTLSFDLLGGDLAMRNIEGLSTNFGLNIFTGTFASPGVGIQMNAPGSTIPGLMFFGAPGSASGVSLAYQFASGTFAAPINVLQINNNGYTRIGNYGPPDPNQFLTVDGDVYINAIDNHDATSRNIFAKTEKGELNVTAGTATDGTDGACMTAIGNTNTSITPGILMGTPGAFIVKSNGDEYPLTNSSPLAYGFQNYTPSTSSIHNRVYPS